MAISDDHLVLPHLRWETFERILTDIGKRRFRIAYRNGNCEFTTQALGHQRTARCIDRMIFLAAMELKVPLCSGGSTTLLNPVREVGIEPDACFWVANERKMRAKKSWNALIDPPPDLALEVDIADCCVDRIAIFAALGVPEVWRFDGNALVVLVLGADGKYRERSTSVAFPALPTDGFAQFVSKLDGAEEVAFAQEFVEWLRSSVVIRKAGGERKKGRR